MNEAESERRAIEEKQRAELIPGLPKFEKNNKKSSQEKYRKLHEPIVVTKKRRNKINSREEKLDPDYQFHGKIGNVSR